MARTVVIVEDHADFRTRATALLEAAGYDVVGACRDGLSALTAIAALRPDAVLLDVQLPDMDGFGVIAQLPIVDRPVVVLISTREKADYGSRVDRCGAAGFITKAELSPSSVARAIGRP